MTAPIAVDASTDLDLRHYLGVIRRRRVTIVLVTLVVFGAALFLSLIQKPVYRATAEVLIQRTASENVLTPGDPQNAQGIQQQIQTEVEVIKSRMIQDAVLKELGHIPKVTVAVRGDTQVVTISARDTNRKTAALEANTYANVYVDQRRQGTEDDLLGATDDLQKELSRLDTSLAAVDKTVTDLTARIAAAPDDQKAGLEAQRAQAQTDATVQRENSAGRRATMLDQIDRLQLEATLNETRGARVVSQAKPPTAPVAPKPRRTGALGFAFGLALGIAAAFLREYLDDTLRTKDDIEALTGLSTLGLIPSVDGWRDRRQAVLESVVDPEGAASEAYRSVRTSLQFLGIDNDLKTILFTSAGAGDGKTTTSANVAVALARAGRRVLLVDCDLRRPRVHQFFNVSPARGFTSVLVGDERIDDCIVEIADVPRLFVMPSGPTPPAPSELLSTRVARDVLAELATLVDYLIIDSPPLLPVADAVVLAGYVDAVVVVATANATTKRSLRRAAEMLQQVNAPVAGTILNGVKPQDTYSYGGYGYAYVPSGTSNGKGNAKPRSKASR